MSEPKVAQDIKMATDELLQAIKSMRQSIELVTSDAIGDGNRSRIILRAEANKLRESIWKAMDGLMNP
ncbi:MAG: hypothetical protein OXT74_00375 [Candidatus Poribacteria bacterium]|nr:hypothetical protein [Candidatus Poribacteria bacterium]